MEQLGELREAIPALREQADVYVINSDTPEQSRQLKQISGIGVPVLLDRDLEVAAQYDMLPKPGQPMGMMQGVAQMGFVIVDGAGAIRVQRVDLNFGEHADQMVDILRLLEQDATPGSSRG